MNCKCSCSVQHLPSPQKKAKLVLILSSALEGTRRKDFVGKNIKLFVNWPVKKKQVHSIRVVIISELYRYMYIYIYI